ncbi:MAG: hypothetical protein ACK5V3_16230 [Bdellovibrionales bacterium]
MSNLISFFSLLGIISFGSSSFAQNVDLYGNEFKSSTVIDKSTLDVSKAKSSLFYKFI